MENDKKHKDYKERFIRWQQLTINQFSFTNNLFLGLNLAFLSFLISQTGFIVSCSCSLLIVQFLTILFLGISFFTGIYLVYNRLKDFQKTTRMIKFKKDRFELEINKTSIKSKNLKFLNNRIGKLQNETYELGEKTWVLLNWQLWNFLLGIISGIVYLILENNLC